MDDGDNYGKYDLDEERNKRHRKDDESKEHHRQHHRHKHHHKHKSKHKETSSETDDKESSSKDKGRHHHRHHHRHRHSKTSSDSGSMNALCGDRLDADQHAAAPTMATSNTNFSPDGQSAAQHASFLDARIEAKRAANNMDAMPSHANSNNRDQHASYSYSSAAAPILEGVERPMDDSEEELLRIANESGHGPYFDFDYDHDQGSESCDSGSGANNIPRADRQLNMNEGEDETFEYPNIQADTAIMEEIIQEGLVDEVGGVEAYVANDEPEIISGNVVGVIKSDEEIAKEERRVGTKYFIGASACLVFLIVVIGVPVTLKLTHVISPTVVLTDEPTMAPSCMPSEAPSSAPTTDHFTRVVAKLLPLSGEVLFDPRTPQHKAARWISDVDEMDMTHPLFEQRYTLAVFYYATNGDDWFTNAGWLTNSSECDWFGIKGLSDCLDGCTSDGQVCGIRMEWGNHINGTIPSEMGILTEMRTFEVQEANLTGTIPSEIGNWNKLSSLLIRDNKLEGSFPATFAPNNRLGTILMNGNRLTGDSLVGFLPQLKNLKWLEAQENLLSGSLTDDISSLMKLEELDLSNNTLTGTIPDTWDETNIISSFKLSHNNITGQLSDTLGRAPNLKRLHVSGNLLTGSIPTSYFNLINLEELYLDGNSFVGGFPQTQEPFYGNIMKLSIHNNDFSGRFPAEYLDPFKLMELSLHNNQLTGTITDEICSRLDPSRANRIGTLTADCELISCDCCTDCY